MGDTLLQPVVWTVISLVSGVIGAGMFARYKINETADSLQRHLEKDEQHHGSVLQRLSGLEAKIDILLERDK